MQKCLFGFMNSENLIQINLLFLNTSIWIKNIFKNIYYNIYLFLKENSYILL